MACRDAYNTNNVNATISNQQTILENTNQQTADRLLFGVDSKFRSFDRLQNNIKLFEWVTRNKIYPDYWGRNINGENCLTKEEVTFLHTNGCKIAAIYAGSDEKETEEQGKILAKKVDIIAIELGIPDGTAIFLELEADEYITTAFMRGFAESLMIEGIIPGFKANTDAAFGFDREFSRGLQTDSDIFNKCLIWSVVPTLEEYEDMTTSHMIHPDNWMPYAPSGMSRRDIAIWQYGKNCHPIENDDGKMTTFNLNLVRNEQVIIDKMF